MEPSPSPPAAPAPATLSISFTPTLSICYCPPPILQHPFPETQPTIINPPSPSHSTSSFYTAIGLEDEAPSFKSRWRKLRDKLEKPIKIAGKIFELLKTLGPYCQFLKVLWDIFK